MNGIHTIKIKNFKAFPEEQPFVLDGKHLLLYGENGSGKSSLYFALYTLLQCSDKTKDAAKYFTRANPQNLLNIFTTDDDGWIEISFKSEPDKFYKLSIAGLVPNEAEDILIKEANLASDFISHRLLINFYNFRNSKEINLFSVFERDILPFITTVKGDNLLAVYNDIRENTPFVLREGGVIARSAPADPDFVKYLENIAYFNDELKKTVENINEKVTEYYVRYFNDGKEEFKIKLEVKYPLEYEYISEKRKLEDVEYTFTSSDFRFLNEPFVKLFIQHKVRDEDKNIDRPQSFLNEAKLTAIALAIRFAVLDDKAQKPEIKILALDDLLISLDMSHREVVLDLLFSKYAEKFQLMLFTHDKAFFNLARKRIKYRFPEESWDFVEMFADVKNDMPIPKVVEAGNYFASALRHFANRDYPACANYLRKEIEGLLKSILPVNNRKRKDGSNISMLGELLPKTYQYFESVGFSTKVLDDIEIYKGILLNPLSHDNAETEIYRIDLEKTFAIAKTLSQIRNEVIVPVDEKIFFIVEAESGKKFEFTIQLDDDLRLFKEDDGIDSRFGKINGKVVTCFEIGSDGLRTETPYAKPYPYKNKPLEEVSAKSSHAVVRVKKETPIAPADLHEMFLIENGKSLKDLMRY